MQFYTTLRSLKTYTPILVPANYSFLAKHPLFSVETKESLSERPGRACNPNIPKDTSSVNRAACCDIEDVHKQRERHEKRSVKILVCSTCSTLPGSSSTSSTGRSTLCTSRSPSASQRLKGFHAPSSRGGSSFILAVRGTVASTMSWILLPSTGF